MSMLYEKMKEELIRKVGEFPLELVDMTDKMRERDNDDGSKFQERFVQVLVEIPRGNGDFSRSRFAVKIPDGVIRISRKDIEEKILYVSFEGLDITYIDPARKEVYFKADNYTVEEVS